MSVSVMTDSGDDRVMIAIDPHKASWTAAAVDGSLQLLATIRVPVSREGYRALRGFARRWPKTGWAIEGAVGLGAPLTVRLRADGIDVVDVPAELAARVRLLSTGMAARTTMLTPSPWELLRSLHARSTCRNRHCCNCSKDHRRTPR